MRTRIFVQELLLLALLIASTCAAMVAFETLLNRERYRQHVRGQALFLAQQMEKPMTWDDRVAISEMLRQSVASDPLLRYAFVERDGAAYAHTFAGGVPSGLLALYPPMGSSGMERKLADTEGRVFYDIGARVGSGRVTVHLGLDRQRVDGRALWPIVWIACMGGGFYVLMIYPAYHVAGTITRQMATMTRRLTDANEQLEVRVSHRTSELQEANRSLQAHAAQITESVGVLSTAARHILDLSAQVAANATETAAAVSETTATVEEVRQTSRVASERARTVAENSQQAATVSLAGRHATDLTIERMNQIRQQMESIAEGIVRLSEQSQAIGGIIATVDDIAEQSNLLAVNAAIEAAKAGEQGRGFAVVAQEIKSLASQSKQATGQVRGILSDIQKATSVAVLATEQGSKAVEAGMSQSRQTGSAIDNLAGSIQEAAQASIQIAASSQQQVAGMTQVAQAMESIKHASAQNVDSMTQLKTAAQNLLELGVKLKEVAARYGEVRGTDPNAAPDRPSVSRAV